MDSTVSKSLAEEEYEALSVIYANEFFILEPENKVYAISINQRENNSNGEIITLKFQHVSGYPIDASLKYELQAPWLSRIYLEKLNDQLNTVVLSCKGSPVVHLLVESIRSFLSTHQFSATNKESEINHCNKSKAETTEISTSLKSPFRASALSVKSHLQISPQILPVAEGLEVPKIYHSHPFTDRKSTFQAHCARVTKLGEVSLFISTLLADRKIAVATHNILAWRISNKNAHGVQNVASDCDDDGETHAGGRLLHLLDISGIENVAVMVSRWYGGIQLGPDRFKHINNVARLVLSENGFLNVQVKNVLRTNKPKNKKMK